MKEWLLFILFILVGLGMVCAGLMYMAKEKNDPESVKIYKAVSVLGVVFTAGAVVLKFVL